MDEVRVLTPTGCIGNRGIHRDALVAALDSERPHAIAVDAGSLDCGPWYLGTGQVHSPMINIRRDLSIVVTEAVRRGIPVIIGSAGGSGARPHVDLTVDVIKEIALREELDFKVGVIYSDVDPEYLRSRIRAGAIIPRVPAKAFGDPLTAEDVESSTRVVAMMGCEPIIAAINQGAQVVVAGRSSDACVIGAYPVMMGFDRGLSLHMGDIMECGEATLTDREGVTHLPGPNRVPVIGAMRRDHFVIRPGHEGMACTVEAVSAHSMYERDNHTQVELPGGVLDKSDCELTQETESVIRVSGTRFREAPYTVLLEGASRVGWRTISMLGVRNPRAIQHLDSILDEEQKSARVHFGEHGDFTVYFHTYGKGAVMGPSEPERDLIATEVGLVVDVVADSQELAHDIAEHVALKIAFTRYPGRTTTAGNVAYLFSPNVVDAGEAYTTGIYHQLPLDDPLELFPITVAGIREV